MRGLPAHHAPSDHAFGVLHRNPALAAFHQNDERHHRNHHGRMMISTCNDVPFAGHEHVAVDLCIALGRPTTMPAKMISDMPLPMPRSVICSPSHMMNAVPVVSDEHRHEDEAEAGIDARNCPSDGLQRRGNAEDCTNARITVR